MREFNGEVWTEKLFDLLKPNGVSKQTAFIGVGNPIKGDDSVGLYIISKLRRRLGASPKKSIHFEAPSTSENALPKLASKMGERKGRASIIVFDSVEANSPPGSIFFANIDDTKYGFFATHNVPMRLIPSIASNSSSIFVVGVQPASTNIGRNLSVPVLASADRIVDTIGKLIEGTR